MIILKCLIFKWKTEEEHCIKPAYNKPLKVKPTIFTEHSFCIRKKMYNSGKKKKKMCNRCLIVGICPKPKSEQVLSIDNLIL